MSSENVAFSLIELKNDENYYFKVGDLRRNVDVF